MTQLHFNVSRLMITPLIRRQYHHNTHYHQKLIINISSKNRTESGFVCYLREMFIAVCLFCCLSILKFQYSLQLFDSQLKTIVYKDGVNNTLYGSILSYINILMSRNLLLTVLFILCHVFRYLSLLYVVSYALTVLSSSDSYSNSRILHM